MHEAVTKSPSPANFFQHNKSDDLLPNNQAKVVSGRDMLSPSSGASRRPQSVGLQKRACVVLYSLILKLMRSDLRLVQLSDQEGQSRPMQTGAVGGGTTT